MVFASPMNGRPTESEHPPYFAGYVSLVPEADILGLLEAQRQDLRALAAAVPGNRETFAYAPGKWTVRQVFGHMGDAERVFGHRAFCIGRGETATLLSFDENGYAAVSPAATYALGAVVDELVLARDANLAVFRRFDETAWRRMGQLSSGPVTPRALAFIMAGHVRHHLRVLAERYDVRPAPR
jgi:hypothetical protein